MPSKLTLAFIALGLFAILSVSDAANRQWDSQWNDWKGKHGRSYLNASTGKPSNETEELHRGIWEQRLQLVITHNMDPNRKYNLTLNEFSDYTDEQLKKLTGTRLPPSLSHGRKRRQADGDSGRPSSTATRPPRRTRQTPPSPSPSVGAWWPGAPPATTTRKTTTKTTPKTTTKTTKTTTTPTTTTPPSRAAFKDVQDWTLVAGVVGPVKNQGNCGSCWAFAAVAALESRYAFAHNATVSSYSEQELVDCSGAYGNGGCGGGWPDYAIQYVSDKRGISYSSNYAYTASNGNCKTVTSRIANTNPSTQINWMDEAGMIAALDKGPLIVAIYASSKFMGYAGGIFTGDDCGSNGINHAVVVVGYGVSGTTPYWKVRNSWGTSWGEQGYVRMLRGQNICSIEGYASYPNIL